MVLVLSASRGQPFKSSGVVRCGGLEMAPALPQWRTTVFVRALSSGRRRLLWLARCGRRLLPPALGGPGTRLTLASLLALLGCLLCLGFLLPLLLGFLRPIHQLHHD